MNSAEIDQAISDLETRLERLRVLYEQYFLGVERIEPMVARKDVDRRFYQLRREKFRNTARRFKFQTLVQRYNTLQQYWTRICREIENGTYRRHKLRAERAFGTVRQALKHEEAHQDQAERATQADRAKQSAEADLATLLASDDFDPAKELESALDNLFAAEARPAPRAAEAPKTSSAPEPTPQTVRSAEPPTNLLGRLKSDARGPRPAAPADLPPKPAPTPSKAAPSAAPGLARPVRSGPPGPPPRRPTSAPPRPGNGPRRSLPPPSMVPRAASSRPGIRPSYAPPRPSPSRPPGPPRGAGPPMRAARPAAAARPSAAARAAQAGGGLDDAKLKELHRRYVEARKQTQAGGHVSLEKLEKSLRATEAKLKQQHGGRSIDFDIVVKGGKAIIKPKLC